MKFWAQVLTKLNNRGLKDVFVFCIDGLKGFPEAVEGVFPTTICELQSRKKVVHDLKEVYQSGTLEGAEAALLRFGEKWNGKYPAISGKWMSNWENLITMYSYPEEIRRVIYTTNAIESLDNIIKGCESALKAVWMTVIPASQKWTMPVSNRKGALNYFYVKFAERLIRVA